MEAREVEERSEPWFLHVNPEPEGGNLERPWGRLGRQTLFSLWIYILRVKAKPKAKFNL